MKQSNPIGERVPKAGKNSEIRPLPLLGVPQESKLTQHIWREPGADPCWPHACYLTPYEPCLGDLMGHFLLVSSIPSDFCCLCFFSSAGFPISWESNQMVTSNLNSLPMKCLAMGLRTLSHLLQDIDSLMVTGHGTV